MHHYEFMKLSHSYYFFNFQVKSELFLWHILPALLDKIKILVALSPSAVWWFRRNLLRTSFGKCTVISHSFFNSLMCLIKVSLKSLKLIKNCHLLIIFLQNTPDILAMNLFHISTTKFRKCLKAFFKSYTVRTSQLLIYGQSLQL